LGDALIKKIEERNEVEPLPPPGELPDSIGGRAVVQTWLCIHCDTDNDE